ncbi:MAG: hypothetical protein R3264_14010, partial [Anaerolineae bacterium]|nr:hypothetical protein [Anaerolineae bacterium]
MEKLRVGYAGTALSSYYAEEYDQYNRAINGLEALSRQWDFELIPIRHGLTDVEMAEQAARELADQQIDFLLLQNATCGLGEQLLSLSKAAPRLGLWSTPDPHQEGEIKLHSLVSMNHYASILKRYLRDQAPPFKWFYGHTDDDRFQRRLGLTIRALTAIKNMAQAKIGWIGGISPGFYNMMFDERKLYARLGTRVIPHEMGEVITLAERYPETEAMAIAGEIKAGASEIRVADAAMIKGSRVYLALKEIAEQNGYDAL